MPLFLYPTVYASGSVPDNWGAGSRRYDRIRCAMPLFIVTCGNCFRAAGKRSNAATWAKSTTSNMNLARSPA